MGWTRYRGYGSVASWSLILGIGLACTPVSEPAVMSPAVSTPVQQAEPARGIALPTLPFRKQAMTIDTLPQRSGEAVTIVGAVRRQVPLIEGQLYQVQDSTGSVWVVTAGESAAVALGDRVSVQGTVLYQDIQVEGSNLSEYYVQAEQFQPEAAAAD